MIVLPGEWASGSLGIGQLSASTEKQIPCPPHPRHLILPPFPPDPSQASAAAFVFGILCVFKAWDQLWFYPESKQLLASAYGSSGPRRQQVAAGCALGSCVREGSPPAARSEELWLRDGRGPATPRGPLPPHVEGRRALGAAPTAGSGGSCFPGWGWGGC